MDFHQRVLAEVASAASVILSLVSVLPAVLTVCVTLLGGTWYAINIYDRLRSGNAKREAAKIIAVAKIEAAQLLALAKKAEED